MSRASKRASRVVTIALALTAAGAVAIAPGAVAKGKKKKPAAGKIRTASAETTALGAFDPTTSIATCPKGTQVIAGGYTTSLPDPPNHWLNVYESQRASKRAWQVSGVEYYAGTDTLTAYAYCQAFKGKVISRSTQTSVPATAGTGTVLQATCPGGTKAISGGFATEGANASDSTLISRSARAGANRWVVDATRLTGPAGRSLFAHAYCLKVQKVRLRTDSEPVLPPLGAQHVALTPACPKGTTTRGGGFATSTPVGGLLNAALVYETRLAGGAWSAAATASSATTSITLLAEAYCR